jgi:hypothetical protein
MLASRQHGQVSRADLLTLGLDDSQIWRWVRLGWLSRGPRGVFSVGHVPGTEIARRQAAVLAGGADASLSHLSAAVHRGLLRWRLPVVDVMVPRSGERDRDGIRVHRPRINVPALDTEVVDGIRCSTVARLLVDVAGVLSYPRFERVAEQAEFLDLLDLEAVARVLVRIKRPRGVRNLRRALGPDRLDAALAGSNLERTYLRLILDAGIERPVLQHPVELTPGEWVHLDCFWPARRLNVEVDGPHHRRPLQARRDARRDELLRARGLTVQRFPDTEIEQAPWKVIERTRALLHPSRDE